MFEIFYCQRLTYLFLVCLQAGCEVLWTMCPSVCLSVYLPACLLFMKFSVRVTCVCGWALLTICSIFYTFGFVSFSLSYLLHLLSCFSIPSHFTRLVPLHFQTGCRRRQQNLALGFCVCWICIICIFSLGWMLVFVVFNLVLSCGVIVVSPCGRC